MKKWLFIVSILLSFGWGTLVFAAPTVVVISEVLFDPSGTDTGLEYVAIKNIGTNGVDLTGWSLYPDGVGYFAFPSFSLSPNATVKVFIRGAGTDSASTLHFSGASGNMGNSSGSIALFSSSTHSSDTIVSFVRYQKPGSSERKTWESSAASAGLWTAGSYVDISTLTEGQAITLVYEEQKTHASGWIVGQSSSVSNSFSDGDQQTELPSNDESVPSSAYSAAAIEPKIKAYGGRDITAMAGASTSFTASAEDLNGRALDGARFLWNFGDGTYQEGRSVTHIFRYPGRYSVVVDVSAGMYSASDAVTAFIVENPVVISEIMPSKEKGFFASLISSDHEGWIEFLNSSNASIDISGVGIALDDTHRFFFPAHSVLAGRAVIVVGDETLGFDIPKSGIIKFLYANGSVMSNVSFDATRLSSGQSLVRNGDMFATATATPGSINSSRGNNVSPAVSVATKTINTKNGGKSSVVTKETKYSGDAQAVVPRQSPYEASALGALSGNGSLVAIRSLYPLGVGAGIALLMTTVIYVIKLLLTRYTKN